MQTTSEILTNSDQNSERSDKFRPKFRQLQRKSDKSKGFQQKSGQFRHIETNFQTTSEKCHTTIQKNQKIRPSFTKKNQTNSEISDQFRHFVNPENQTNSEKFRQTFRETRDNQTTDHFFSGFVFCAFLIGWSEIVWVVWFYQMLFLLICPNFDLRSVDFPLKFVFYLV